MDRSMLELIANAGNLLNAGLRDVAKTANKHSKEIDRIKMQLAFIAMYIWYNECRVEKLKERVDKIDPKK